MPTIKVNTNKLISYKNELQGIQSGIGSVNSQFSSVSGNLDWDIRAASNISSRMSAIERELYSEFCAISEIKDYIGLAVRQYDNVENINSREKLKNSGGGSGKFFGGDFQEELKDSEKVSVKFFTADASVSYDVNYGKYEDNKKLIKQNSKPYCQINKDNEWYQEDATLFEAKIDAKLQGSVVDAKVSGDTEYAQGEAEAKVATAEAHASATAGLYVYKKGPDGEVEKVLSPNVMAEVGASVAMVDVSASGRVGLGEDNNMLGVYGKGRVQVAEAEVNAKASFGPNELYAGASAEANLAKAEGAVGISVLGTDVGLTGALKVGVGAHAQVGFTDGQLKVDVGAAVGVGFDVGFEVDIKGTVDAVMDWTESVWDKIK